MKKILILTSNPRNDLKLDREIKDLKNVIKRSKNQSEFATEFELEVHPEELQDLLLEHELRIIHFCGHGTGESGLVLENQTGQEQVISTEALSNLFELFENQVECAILNACYSEAQVKAIVRHINYNAYFSSIEIEPSCLIKSSSKLSSYTCLFTNTSTTKD